MPDDHRQVEDLLVEIPLFHGLEAEQLVALAREFDRVSLKAGQLLFNEGEPGDSAFIISKGEVRVTHQEEDEQILLSVLGPGDLFGEEALIYKRLRSATITATAPTELLEMKSEVFERLLRTYPHMRLNLLATAESRRLSRRMRFDWLGVGEVVHLVARKHPARLVLALLGPVIVVLFSLPIFYLAYLSGIFTPYLLGGALALIALAWGGWNWLDWGNDYYIVTSQRVVWLERVVGLYDSRQEAPLRTVLSVVMESDPFGRILGYGDVVVRTYTGRIVMRHVGRPAQLAALVEQFWLRTRRRTEQEESELIEEALRQRLGMDELEEAPPSEEAEAAPPVEARPLLDLILASLVKMRYQEGSVITYRKHWILLLGRIWLPTLLLGGVAVSVLARLAGYLQPLSWRTILVVSISFVTVLGAWWLYEFIDWRNDMYQLTPDHIVDIDRKPLGTEQKRSAPLENILSLDYERMGLLGLLLNYGNVKARIGAAQFTFDGVHDPARVQQDIFARMDERRRQKAEAEAARERERMAEWLVTYHRTREQYPGSTEGQPPGSE